MIKISIGKLGKIGMAILGCFLIYMIIDGIIFIRSVDLNKNESISISDTSPTIQADIAQTPTQPLIQTPGRTTTAPITLRNVVILIDSSGSTGISSGITTPTRISLINANAISIVRNINSDSHVGVIAFSNSTRETSILPMSSEANKAELEIFIRKIRPNESNNPTDFDKGFLVAETFMVTKF